MRYHFIAIGGSVMHNLALALAAEGHSITGSDDDIQDPSRSRLLEAGLLPEEMGWHTERITAELDAVIVGMHARPDNPELAQAQQMNLPVYSFPEFIYQHARNKQRVVIAGSHGKTTITSMIMHVLRERGIDFDYLVGGQVEGFKYNVRLSDKAPMILLEGDEYAASPLDPRPKFLIYKPHVVILSGIAWDHVNVFPTETDYVQSFRQLMQILPKAGMVVYNSEDERVTELVRQYTEEEKHYRIPYEAPAARKRAGTLEVKFDKLWREVLVYGKHNLMNMSAAYQVCKLFAVEPEEFLQAISSFKGASLRLQKIFEDRNTIIIRDFAHSPSKVKATVAAVAERYPEANIIVCLELHTFSSLNKTFISQYRNTLKKFVNKIVMINRRTMAQKKMEPLSVVEIKKAFNDSRIQVAENQQELVQAIVQRRNDTQNVILLMSSGNMDNLSPEQLIKR